MFNNDKATMRNPSRFWAELAEQLGPVKTSWDPPPVFVPVRVISLFNHAKEALERHCLTSVKIRDEGF